MTTLNNDESHTLTNAKTALRAYAEGIEADPQNNSVFAYARDLFRSLEDGEQSTQDLSALINEVFSRLITERAERFAAQHAETDALDSRLRHLAAQGWQVFKQAVETPNGGIVFTAHPTFALSRETRQAFADYATQPRDISRAALEDEIAKDSRSWSQTISLKGEHSEVQSAIAHAQSALKAYLQRIYALAETAFPETWTGLRPAAPSLASWVGYDLDGRTDIHWSQSFALRLGEKAEQLARYVAALDKLVAGGETESASALLAIRNRLQEAQEVTSSDYAAFDTDLTQPNALVQAANTLTTPDSRRLTHLTDQIAQLRAIAKTEGETAPAIARACL
ncbi:MAG: phosphoenolpyruvate carboxylase, partial [Pseudomonadota bacterium]